MIACKHESISGANVMGGQDCAYALKCDAEVTMTQTPVNASDMSRLTPQDQVGLMPHTTRSAVEFCMKGNGTSEWVIEKMQPRQVFEAKSYTLPDPSVKTKTIRIVNDQATYMDAGGNVIRTAEFKVSELTAGLNNMMNLAKKGSTDTDFDKMLADARAANAEIVDMGEGVFTITKQLPNTSDRIAVMVDKTIGRVLSNAVLNDLGNVKYVVAFTYEKTEQPILKTVIQRSFTTSPDGIAMKSEKVIEFIKLEFSGQMPDKTNLTPKN
jgi:hypothetical protein